VQNKNALPNFIRRNPLTDRQPVQIDSAQDYPDVPVLPETMLFLDLLVQEPCINLREMSQLVLADLGATLQILRLAGREFGNAEGRPVRMEDCISDLGVMECLDVVSRKMLPRDNSQHEIAELWAHAREIAHHARLIGEDISDVNPEEAYLAGLLHIIGLLPSLLGWRKTGANDGLLVGLMLARKWCLPHCVTELFSEIHPIGYATRFQGIVRKAHVNAGQTTIPCPLDSGVRLTLVEDSYNPQDPSRIQ
jgi:HD-like signal output (HDOD) protein